ncbi:hypothetical protein HPB49_010253 [Dermacentor silvarum]|uniref:Uncharacterized protein n=1 Tax=Dermacentor silvarum TaxID=543639 RepID=A0ACB8CEC4_DERSI|nr:hypothetical protein HPB49_010253 [Dermacentor silvarum]
MACRNTTMQVVAEYYLMLHQTEINAGANYSKHRQKSATMALNDSASGTAMQQLLPAAAPTSSVEDMSDCCSMDTSTAANSCDQSVQQTVDKYKMELKTLHEDDLVADVSYIKERVEEKEPAARFFIYQIQNFMKKSPSWCEEITRRCVVLRYLSARAYEHIRSEMLLTLPCRKTLSNYVGYTSGETGFSKLAEDRLRVEAESLSVPQSTVRSLGHCR